jgi:hypothetical protein
MKENPKCNSSFIERSTLKKVTPLTMVAGGKKFYTLKGKCKSDLQTR